MQPQVLENTFEHHIGIPGHRGGSLPRGESARNPITPDEANRKVQGALPGVAQGDVDQDRKKRYIPTSAEMSSYKKAIADKYNKKIREGLKNTKELQTVKEILSERDDENDDGIFAQDVWAEKYPDMEMTLAEYVDGAYNYTDEASGLEAKVDYVVIDENDGQVIIKGKIFDSEGEVGKFTRDLNPESKSVHNALFKLYGPDAQRTGFGRRYYQHQEDAALVAGFEKIEINANIDVGGYAWARMGYSFDPNSNSAEEIGSSMLSDWQNEFLDVDFPLPDFSEAYELALVESPDGEPWGKQQMLGSDWMAVKPLDVNDPGFLAGQLYYESKADE